MKPEANQKVINQVIKGNALHSILNLASSEKKYAQLFINSFLDSLSTMGCSLKNEEDSLYNIKELRNVVIDFSQLKQKKLANLDSQKKLTSFVQNFLTEIPEGQKNNAEIRAEVSKLQEHLQDIQDDKTLSRERKEEEPKSLLHNPEGTEKKKVRFI